MAYADWNVLMMWTLGWGADRSHETVVLPPPDGIFAAITCIAVTIYALQASYAAADVAKAASAPKRGRDSAPPPDAVLLPVFLPLLHRLAAALGILAVVCAFVCACVNVPSPSAALLGPFNFLRTLTAEAIHHGITIFFLQPTISKQSLSRTMLPAGIIALALAVLDAILLGLYFYAAEDSAVPKVVMACADGVIALVYGVLILVLNWGRPALRPWAWFTVIWRSMAVLGFIMCLSRPPGFPVLIYDFTFMSIMTLGFPLSLFSTLRSDTMYWRGLCRQTAAGDVSSCSALVSVLCGAGDVGVGLGLRGWGLRQRRVLHAAHKRTLLGSIQHCIACTCCCGDAYEPLDEEEYSGLDDAAADDAVKPEINGLGSIGQPLLPFAGAGGTAARGQRSSAGGYGSTGDIAGIAAPASSHIANPADGLWRGIAYATGCGRPTCCCQPVLVKPRWSGRRAHRAVRCGCIACPTSPSWTCIVDALLLPCTVLQRSVSRSRRWSNADDFEVVSDAADGSGGSGLLLAIGMHGSTATTGAALSSAEASDTDDDGDVTAAQAAAMEMAIDRWATTPEVMTDDPMGCLMDLLESSRSRLLDFAYLRLDALVHNGAMTVVFKGTYARSDVAIKVFRPPVLNDAAVREFADEASACTRIEHPYIVSYKGMCCCPPDVSLVFEWCAHGNLRSVLDKMVRDAAGELEPVIRAAVADSKHLRVRSMNDPSLLRGMPYLPVRYLRRGVHDAYVLRRRAARQASRTSSASSTPARMDSTFSGSSPLDDLGQDQVDALMSASTAGKVRVIVIDDDRDDSDLPVGGSTLPPAVVTSGQLYDAVTGRAVPLEAGAHVFARSHTHTGLRVSTVPAATVTHVVRSGQISMTSSSMFSASSGSGGIPSVRHADARNMHMISLHDALRRDIALLGGDARDVDDCPYDDPTAWPVWDVLHFADCWQFDPLTGTALAGLLNEGDDAPGDGLEEEGGDASPFPASAEPSQASDTADSRPRRKRGAKAGTRRPKLNTSAMRTQVLDWLSRLRAALHVATALRHMHSFSPPFLHRDIKSLNILLTADWTAKLCDLGDAKGLKVLAPMTGQVGTWNWLAPESFLSDVRSIPDDFAPSTAPPSAAASQHVGGWSGAAMAASTTSTYTQAADVYSFSLVMWELLVGGTPYSLLSRTELTSAVCSHAARPPIPASAPRAYAHLLRCGWHPDYTKRPSMGVFVIVLQRLVDEARRHFRLDEVALDSTSHAAGAQHAVDGFTPPAAHRQLQLSRELSARGSGHIGPLAVVSAHNATAIPIPRAAAVVGALPLRSVPEHARHAVGLSESLAAAPHSHASRGDDAFISRARDGMGNTPPQAPLGNGALAYLRSIEATRAPIPAGYDVNSDVGDDVNVEDIVDRVAASSQHDTYTVDADDAASSLLPPLHGYGRGLTRLRSAGSARSAATSDSQPRGAAGSSTGAASDPDAGRVQRSQSNPPPPPQPLVDSAAPAPRTQMVASNRDTAPSEVSGLLDVDL